MSFPTSDCRALTQQVVTTAPNTNAFLWKETFTSKSTLFLFSSFSFFHFIQVGKKTCLKDFVAEKVEGKANIIRGCLTQGSLGTTGPLEGEGSEDLPTI